MSKENKDEVIRIMNQFSIKDVEALTGIKSHTLRIWESRYGIPHPKRTTTNIRFYDDDDVKLLLSVSALNRHGYKISKISSMTDKERSSLVFEISQAVSDNVIQIDALTTAMFNFDEVLFEQILSSYTLKHGFVSTFTDIVFPFFSKVGMLWQTGNINPAYEHFITNLIRQKLFVAADAQPKHVKENGKKFLLFLPSYEPHEIGLLFANYLIRSKGHHTNYLGPNLPIDDLGPVMQLYKADYILTVLTAPHPTQTPLFITKKLSHDFPNTKILLSGFQMMQANIHLPSNVKVLSSMNDLVLLLDTLNS
ncbi:MAG: MerR family transcriptional regulator [Bacteroidota bacterium]